MNLLYKFFIFLFFATLFSKPLIPMDANKDASVLIKNKSKNYRYYELGKDGLSYSSLEGFSNEDSVRIKLFIRQVIAEKNNKEQNFGVKLVLNEEDEKEILFTNKNNSMRKISNRPGWTCTDAGIWFIDIMFKDFKSLSIKEIKGKALRKFLNDDLIIRAQVSKIARVKSTPKTIHTINIEDKYKIDTFNTKAGEKKSLISRDWYRLESNQDELQFEVVGPTSIRVFSRIGFPSATRNNEYHIFIKENGLDIGTFYFTTELSSMSNLAKTGEKVSKWRTCWINVPKGKHYYTIRKGINPNTLSNYEGGGPDKEQGIESNPIYIRVKRYDKN